MPLFPSGCRGFFVLAALAALSATPLLASADLTVHVYGAQDAAPGSAATFYVGASNGGPDVAHDAVVSIAFTPPSSFGSLIFCFAGNQSCDGADGLYTLALGDLTPGRTVLGTVSVIPAAGAAGGTLTCAASIAASAADGSPVDDPNPDDDTASQTISVLMPPADLFLRMIPRTALVGPGQDVRFDLAVGNGGPGAAGQVTASIVLPPGLTAASCATAGGTPCAIGSDGISRVTYASWDVGAFLGYDQYGLPIHAPADSIVLHAALDPSARPGAELLPEANLLSVLNSEPNYTDNYATSVVLVAAPPSVATSVSTGALHFPPTAIADDVLLPVTLTNTSGAPITVAAPFLTGDFLPYDDTCFPGGVSYPIDDRTAVLQPGQACTTRVAFQPAVTGPRGGLLVLRQVSPVGQQVVALDGEAVGLEMASAVDFPLTPVGSTSHVGAQLTNRGPVPIRITGIAAAGPGFSSASACPDALQPRDACVIDISFSPARAGLASGSLTITDDDVLSPRILALTGRAAATTLTGFPQRNGRIDFGARVLAIPVTESLTLTNVAPDRAVVNRISVSGDAGFSQRNDCPAALPPGASCQVHVAFEPGVLAPRDATLTIQDKETGASQTVPLTGEGIGIGAEKRLYLHYDYMVLPDQGTACTPVSFSPLYLPTSPDCAEGQHCIDGICRGHSHEPPADAIRKVVDVFAARGVRLDVDPVSRPIPEYRYLFPSLPFPCYGVNPDLSDAASYFDLRAAYYRPATDNKHEHYAIFGHYGFDGNCNPIGGYSPSIPGYDFFVTLGTYAEIDPAFIDPGELRDGLGGTWMHEFGHNLGLLHPDPNFTPNVISVMNYLYQFGIAQADAVGSDVPDPDLTLVDYSIDVLPAAGNTPGRLVAADLNEPDGLGSGNARIFAFESPSGGVLAPSQGPVDWDGDGVADNPHAADPALFALPCPGCPGIAQAAGRDDWAFLFTGDDHSGRPEAARAAASQEQEPELTVEEAMKRHILLVPRAVRLMVLPPDRAPGNARTPRAGTRRIAILGANDLDATRIEPASLGLAGSAPATHALTDVNGDGRPDLVLTFDPGRVSLDALPSGARLTGWLANSRRIVGDVAAALRAAGRVAR